MSIQISNLQLNCCGVYSPEDYRTPRMPTIFPPDVPISCCPTYAPDRSALVQERERETCKARKEYFDIGCKNLVIEVLRESSTIVLGVTVPMIIFEVSLSLVPTDSGLSQNYIAPRCLKSICGGLCNFGLCFLLFIPTEYFLSD